jgi:hypothetical protein
MEKINSTLVKYFNLPLKEYRQKFNVGLLSKLLVNLKDLPKEDCYG